MNNQTTILFRDSLADEGELSIAREFFPICNYRAQIKPNQMVIPRYSALPYYDELEKDVEYVGATLINTYAQHRWIADFQYYDQLADYTPETWTSETLEDAQWNGPFVVKGRTNSRKNQWRTHMFAPTKKDARLISYELASDSMIGYQGILFRKYVPLLTYEIGINGLPFSNEWRFFFLDTTELCHGFYWFQMDDLSLPRITEDGIKLANDIARIASQYVRFFVLDIAQTLDGSWILIEMNDGTMSGLSMCDPRSLYGNLEKIMR